MTGSCIYPYPNSAFDKEGREKGRNIERGPTSFNIHTYIYMHAIIYKFLIDRDIAIHSNS